MSKIALEFHNDKKDDIAQFLRDAGYEVHVDNGENNVGMLYAVVYLCAADKYRRPTHRLSKDQKGLKERVLMASQQLSHPW